MSYKIQYSPENAHQYPQTEKKQRKFNGKWIAVVFAISAALWMYFRGIPDFLIPGDAEVTKSAASTLIDELQNGESVNDAVTAFCKIILDGAEVAY